MNYDDENHIDGELIDDPMLLFDDNIIERDYKELKNCEDDAKMNINNLCINSLVLLGSFKLHKKYPFASGVIFTFSSIGIVINSLKTVNSINILKRIKKNTLK